MKTKSLFFGLILVLAPFFASAAAHPAGTNVISNGTVYMVTTDGQLRPYTSAGAFLSYGFNSFATVVPANADDLLLPIGSFIPPRDGQVTCSDRGGDKGTCYLISDGKKAGFTSSDVFSKLGFNFKRVLYGDVSFLPSTTNISDTAQSHLPGTLINDNGTVKLVGSGGTVGVPSVDTLKSWGYSLDDVVPANTADKTIPQTEVLPPHNSGELAPLLPTMPPCTTSGTTSCVPPCKEASCIPQCTTNTTSSNTGCITPTPVPCPSNNTNAVSCIPTSCLKDGAIIADCPPCPTSVTTTTCVPMPTPVPPPPPCATTGTTSTTCTDLTLVGTVRDNNSIDVKTPSGVAVTTIRAGTYRFYAVDETAHHNFHLTGPGVDQSTTIEGITPTVWTVTFTPGTYTYVCDAHNTVMKGSLTVVAATTPPPPPPPPTPVHLNGLTPTTGPIGTLITIPGSGFTATGNIIHFGLTTSTMDAMGTTFPNISSTNNAIVFPVPAKDNPMCPTTQPTCPIRAPMPVAPGLYYLFVSNTSGSSNVLNFTVTSTTMQCEYPAAPDGYHYEGGQSYPTCGAHLAPNVSTTPTPVPPPAPPPTTTTSNVLLGTVRDNATIDMKKNDVLVTSVPAGTYKVYVADQSAMHNFHLTGPGGIDMKTTVDGIGNTVWMLNLTPGTYTYVCDPHSGSMHGSFTVTN
jgi:plastocyanin